VPYSRKEGSRCSSSPASVEQLFVLGEEAGYPFPHTGQALGPVVIAALIMSISSPGLQSKVGISGNREVFRSMMNGNERHVFK
jgi:hypothetical protein